jgi:hypothetical protein
MPDLTASIATADDINTALQQMSSAAAYSGVKPLSVVLAYATVSGTTQQYAGTIAGILELSGHVQVGVTLLAQCLHLDVF